MGNMAALHWFCTVVVASCLLCSPAWADEGRLVRIRDDVSGEPVVGARVVIQLSSSHSYEVGETDSRGESQISEDIAHAAKFLSILHPLFDPLNRPFPTGSDVIDLRVVRAETGTIHGSVVDHIGRPIPNAHIVDRRPELRPQDHTLTRRILCTTDSQGQFSLKLRSGPWSLWAIDQVRVSEPVLLNVAPAASFECALIIPEYRTLHVRVNLSHVRPLQALGLWVHQVPKPILEWLNSSRPREEMIHGRRSIWPQFVSGSATVTIPADVDMIALAQGSGICSAWIPLSLEPIPIGPVLPIPPCSTSIE